MKAKSRTTTNAGKKKQKSSGAKARKSTKDHNAYLASLIENISDALISTDMEFNILEWNPAAQRMYGWSMAEVMGQPYNQFVQSEYINTDGAEIIKTVLKEGIWKGEVTQQHRNGTRFPVLASVSMVKDETGAPLGFVTVNRDISERKQAEKQIVQMQRLYATLSQVNQTIVHVRDRKELYESICDVAVQFGEFSLAWVGLWDETSGDVRPVAANGLDITQWPFPNVNIQQEAFKHGLIATAIRTSRVVTSEEVSTDKRVNPLYEQFEKYAYRASAAIPFRLRGKAIGVLCLTSPEADLFQAEAEVRLLEEMGLDISFALDTMETEAERRQTEESYTRLFRAVREGFAHYKGIYAGDRLIDLQVLEINPTGAELSGVSRENQLGKTWREVWPGVDENLFAIYHKVDETGETFRFDNDNNLTGRWYDVQIFKIANAEFIVTFNDITERKRAEAALAESEKRFRKLIEKSTDAIAVNAVDGTVLYVSPGVEQITGIHAQVGDHVNPFQRIHPEDLALSQHMLAELMRNPLTTKTVQFRIQHPNGSWRWVEVIGTNLSDEPGVGGIVSNFRDITERKQAEAQLRHSEENFSKAFSSSPIALMITRLADGKYLALNEAYARLVGYEREELLGHLTTEFNIYRYPEQRQEILNELRARGSLYNYEATIQNQAGEPRTVLASLEQIQFNGEDSLLTTLLDITERKQAEEQLRYQAYLLENVNDAIVASDARFQLKAWNFAAEEMYGWKSEDVLGRNGVEILQTKFSEADAEEMRRQIAEAGYYVGEATQLRKDGTRIPVEVASIVLRDESGQITDYLSVNRDITERKRAEEKIQQQLQRLDSLRTIDTAITSSFDLRVTLDIVLQQVVAQLGVDAASILLFNSQNQTLEYMAGYGFHSAAISQSNLALGEGSAGQVGLTRKLIHFPDLAAVGNRLVRTELVRKENFVTYFGVPLIDKEMLKGVLEIFHRSALNPDPEWLSFLEILARQAAIAIDNVQLWEQVQQHTLELEQRVAQRTAELNQANIDLEYANRTKSEFLANMSHELRTPLNSILGLSESLLEQQREPLSQRQQKYIQTMASSGQHLLDMINDILDLSKIEAGKFDYFPEAVSVEEICKSSLSFVKSQASKKSITVTYTQNESVAKIYADPRRLKQILVNLLTNAVKFTPEKGQVVLQVNADLDKDQIQFALIDTGIGIDPGHLQQLFQPFVQIDSGLNRQQEGTGLGLALVQRLTDLHGGSVEVESEVGKGSRFTVNLPWHQKIISQAEVNSYQPLSEQNVVEIAEQISENILVLLTEDNMANIMTIGDYLENHGYRIAIAHNGLEAIQLANQLDPNIILMDIQMPGMDGLDAMRLLRANPRFATTPIIALTALAMPGDRERCLEAGANEYMSKPVSLKLLNQTIQALLAKRM